MNTQADKLSKFFYSLVSASMILFVPIESIAKNTSVVDKELISHTFNKKEFVSILVKSSKKAYKVNEPMMFTVIGEKNFYLYIFNVTNNKNTRLYPNITTKSNFFYAGKTYHLPQKVQFHSKKVGEERLLFIATSKRLKLNNDISSNTIMLSEGSLDENLQTHSENASYELEAFLTLIGSKKSEDISDKAVKQHPIIIKKGVRAEPKLLKIKVYR